MKKTLVIQAWLCLLLFFSVNEAEGIENSCVNCHRDMVRNTFIRSKYPDWEGSIHAKEGVACERCHGGNPNATRKEAAHTGIYNSSDPKSRVYYKSVPGTCGACHRRDYNAFRRSTHYTFLEKTGAGPTCATCHESHTTRIISPGQIPAVCEQCHNQRRGISPHVPMHAQALLLLINQTAFMVRHARGKIEESDREEFQAWREVYETMETARDEWHGFNLSQVQITILKAYDGVKRFLEKKK